MAERSKAPRRISLCLSLALACASFAASPDTEHWQTLAERDGVTLSRPQEAVGAVVPSRGVTVVEAPFFEVLAVIQDVPRHVEWRPRCVESRSVPGAGDGAPLIYSRSAGNWLVADRDSVVRSKLSSEKWGRDARVAFESVDSPLVPPVDGVVRTPFVTGHYVLESLGPERTRVAYQIGIDIGGYVPGFALRFVSEEMPIDTLVRLREQVAKTRGEYGELVGRWQALDALPGTSRATP